MLAELVTKSQQLAEKTGNARFIKQASNLVNYNGDYSDGAWRNRKGHHAHVANIAEGVIRAAGRK